MIIQFHTTHVINVKKLTSNDRFLRNFSRKFVFDLIEKISEEIFFLISFYFRWLSWVLNHRLASHTYQVFGDSIKQFVFSSSSNECFFLSSTTSSMDYWLKFITIVLFFPCFKHSWTSHMIFYVLFHWKFCSVTDVLLFNFSFKAEVQFSSNDALVRINYDLTHLHYCNEYDDASNYVSDI